MLLDLTKHVPLVDPVVCRTSAVVRVRAVEENHKTALWYYGNHNEAMDPANARWMVHLEPSQTYEEGGNQRILDYLMTPPLARRQEDTREGIVHSFRVATALPRADRPWDYQTFWIILHSGSQALGIQPRLMVDHPKHRFIIELVDYEQDSIALPPFRNMIERRDVQTFWDRLIQD